MYTQELASNMVVRTFLEGTHRSVTETLFLHTINAQPSYFKNQDFGMQYKH